MQPNPYESPKSPTAFDSLPLQPATDSTHELLRTWEYRRLWFNAILIVGTVLMGILPEFLFFQPRYWGFAIEGAIAANVCFCVGPIVTWYLSHLGFNSRRAGALLFLVGTMLSMMLTLIAIVTSFVPWQD
jgi:hypothetical protein